MATYIYIAGPLYGSEHQDDNIRRVLEVASVVRKLGFIPFVPHLYFFWNLMQRQPREFWLDLDKWWLKKCDGMLRIQGESPGSVLEEGWCEQFNIPFRIIDVSVNRNRFAEPRQEVREKTVAALSELSQLASGSLWPKVMP